MNPRPFPFFVGANGSGTTLHRAIFDSHPDLAIPGESQFIVKLRHQKRQFETTNGFDTPSFLKSIGNDKRFANWNVPLADVERELSAEPPANDLATAIRRVYQAYAHSEEKTLYGDKTQSYVHHLPLLAEMFPEAVFVHAVRDGRNVALAHDKGENIEKVALSWARRVLAAQKAQSLVGKDRYIESRYEDLIDSPESSVRRICEWMSLDYSPEMLRYYERSDKLIATTASPGRHADIKKPPTKDLQVWSRDLSRDQIARFEAIAGSALDALGYERAFDKVPPKTKAIAWRRVATHVGRSAMRKFNL